MSLPNSQTTTPSNNNDDLNEGNSSSSIKSSSGTGPWWWTFGSVPELSAQQLYELNQSNQNSLQIVVRTETEYNNGHIEGSINCSFLPNVFSFSSRMKDNILPKLDKHKPVFCICLSANRSIAAVKWLSQQGYSAFQLKGGMQEWRKEQLPEVGTHNNGAIIITSNTEEQPANNSNIVNINGNSNTNNEE